MDLDTRIDEAMKQHRRKHEARQQQRKQVEQRIEQQLREALGQALGPDLFAQFTWTFTLRGDHAAGLPAGPKLLTRYKGCTWSFLPEDGSPHWTMYQQKPEGPAVSGGFVSAQALAQTFLVDLGRWRERHP